MTLIVAANVISGLNYPTQKLALRGVPPVTLLLVRNVVGLVPMVLLLRHRRVGFGTYTRADFTRVFLLGVFAYGLPMLLGIVGVGLSTASNASILVLLEPPVIVVIAWLFLRERVSGRAIAAVALGLAGAITIVLEGASTVDLLGGEHLVGNAILALHGILWGLYTPFVKSLAERQDPFGIAGLTLVSSTLPFVPFAALEWPAWTLDSAAFAGLGWAVVIGLFSSFGATVLWIGSLRYLAASTTAPFVFLQPLTGVCAGALFLDERLTPAALVGAVLIGGAVVLVTHRRARPSAG